MKFMLEAIKEAYLGINNNHGGPFGCVIVKQGKIIGRGHNKVLLNKDATCHGEMEAIRDASSNIGSHDLSGCELYTTGEPCPMCLCATMWANISKVYFGCTIKENEMIGFRDDKFYKVFGSRVGIDDYLVQLGHDECLKLFKDYSSTNRENY